MLKIFRNSLHCFVFKVHHKHISKYDCCVWRASHWHISH